MNLAALEKRLRKIELIFLRRKRDCCCRWERETKYHCAGELGQIMNSHCPSHQFRDLGEICWVPIGTPLLPDDRNLCACPPSPTRNLLEGKIEFLTLEQQEAECAEWLEEFNQKALTDFHVDQARVAALLHEYLKDKRSNYANMRG